MDNKEIKERIEIAKIIAKSIEESASLHELAILEEWINKSQDNKFFYRRLIKDDKLDQKLSDYKSIDVNKAKKRFTKKNKRNFFVFQIKKYLKYAAVLVVVLGSFYFLNQKETSKQLISIPKNSITLQMDDGTIKVISTFDTKEIKNKKGEIVGKQERDKLNYKDSKLKELVYNELTVPYGKTFQLVLSDGTKVNLNAGSSLKYPVSFIEGQDRKVFLEGEAYFDVAKDPRHPFVLNSNEVNIRVLGTKFNVSSYSEDTDISTVLVEGSISLYLDDKYAKDKSLLLKPGFKASWNKKTNKMNVGKVDTEIYTGWTEGKLIIKDLPFKNIRKKLERKYDVKIINNNKILDNNTYTATFDVETIEQVLQTLNKSFSIEYKINGNEIIIN